MKVYGSAICIDCRNYKAIQASRGFAAEFIDITANTANLKEFLFLRDHAPLYAALRERGGIGIPLFVREDDFTVTLGEGAALPPATMTFDLDEALGWIGQPPVQNAEIVERRAAAPAADACARPAAACGCCSPTQGC